MEQVIINYHMVVRNSYFTFHQPRKVLLKLVTISHDHKYDNLWYEPVYKCAICLNTLCIVMCWCGLLCCGYTIYPPPPDIGSTLVQVMACRFFGAKSSPKPMLSYCRLDALEQTLGKFESKYRTFHPGKFLWRCCLRNSIHLVQARWVNVVL